MPNYKFIVDIATADIAFEAFGKTYSELFENAALALEETMVDTKTVKPVQKGSIVHKAENIEHLLFDFLQELIYLKDTDNSLFCKFECKVTKDKKGKWINEVNMVGDEIDIDKHELRNDVKAITKHLFEVKQLASKNFKCQVVVDV